MFLKSLSTYNSDILMCDNKCESSVSAKTNIWQYRIILTVKLIKVWGKLYDNNATINII
jgi:hypothetical protein